ncbi:MAG: signal recognition particle protein [Deltaproteobacteria bacterium]|nr:signal recognition particle protein [Deltaproteobacteria bacterium]
MFDNLSERLNETFKKLRGHGKLSEDNIKAGLKEVRMALLEADVNYKVAKNLVDAIKDRSIGQEVMTSLTPGQQVVKIVHDELITLMGGQKQDLNLTGPTPQCIMLVGLQGSGKTTTCGKLARMLSQQNKSPFLVPADIYRPAAILQLQKLAKELNVPVFPSEQQQRPVDICGQAVDQARINGYQTLIIDTAGRLHVDEALMDELKQIKARVGPCEILLVADAMTGQDAVNVAQKFNEILDITGVILSKMEGDARGGAALSIKAVTNKPIKFIGIGEKLDALEVFHPDRMAGQILGMGDVLTLIEKAQSTIDEKAAREMEKKLRQDAFTLVDFRDQLRQIRKMGPLENLLSMIPGMKQMKGFKDLKPDEKEFVKIEAMIDSMTLKERVDPAIINGSRRKRIALGSGTTVQDVNRLLKNFSQVRKIVKQMTKGGGKKALRRGMLPF